MEMFKTHKSGPVLFLLLLPMEMFKTHKSCLVLFLLFFLCSSPYPGESLSPTKETTTQQVPTGLTQDGQNMPLLTAPPFPTPLINKDFSFVPSLNNQGQQPQTVYQQPQLNYPQQSLNQPFSGFTQPFSSINQPFLGVNQPYSTVNRPLGVSNQQGLADNTAFDNGVSGEKRIIVAVALVSLTTLMTTLGFIV